MGELTCGQEWEVNVMERLAEISETDLLDLAQGIAALLTGDLTQAKTAALSGQAMTPEEANMLRCRIDRMAVMLDVLQLRYGDAAVHEQTFLEYIEASFE